MQIKLYKMLRKITIIFLLISSLNLIAQNYKPLNGKWIFKKALNKEVDDDGRKTLKSDIINKMTFEFMSNNNFIAFAFGQNMKGTWKISEDLKVIDLNVDNEKIQILILKLNESEIILKIGLGEFLMKKI